MNTYRHHIILSIVLCFGACFAYGQSDVPEAEPAYRHQFGFNTIGLFNLLNTDSGNSKYQSPYLFTYALELGKVVFRAGIGPEYTTETIVHDGFTDSEENTLLRIDARVGAGIVVLDDQRWQAVAGIDLASSYRRERMIEDSGFDRITTQQEKKGYGGGPFLQFSYHLSRRVSLGAEASVYYMNRTDTVTELFENFPDFNNIINENTGSELEITLPNTVFIRFHF